MIINRTDHHKINKSCRLNSKFRFKDSLKNKTLLLGSIFIKINFKRVEVIRDYQKNTPNFFKLWKNYPGYKCLWVSVFNSLCKQDKYGEKTCCITFGFFFGNTNILKCYCFWTFCRINRNAALGETKQKRKKLE